MSKFIRDIKENYLKMERELATQLNYDVTNHQLTAGSHREEVWTDFFRRIVPKKFNITRSVFIIDSNQNVSNEVDIAIYDEQYTPYIFNYGLIQNQYIAIAHHFIDITLLIHKYFLNLF